MNLLAPLLTGLIIFHLIIVLPSPITPVNPGPSDPVLTNHTTDPVPSSIIACSLAHSKSYQTSKSLNHPTRPTKSSPSFIFILLLLSGNVEVNPGPSYKFPCGHCQKPCKSNQKNLKCSSCHTWHHIKCSNPGMTRKFQLIEKP